MLCEKCLGIPIWVWLVVVGIVVFSCYKTTEKFANDETKPNETAVQQNQNAASTVSGSPNVTKVKVYNFWAGWCGYSRRFLPVWTEFEALVKSKHPGAQAISVETDIENDKAQSEKNMALANQFGVRGYPTVIFEYESNGKVNRKEYEGSRDVDSLVTELKSHL